MSGAILTDAVIIGAGPCGLFSVFQLGLLDIRCHVVDALDRPGGQCAELYPEKPIYDIPAFRQLTGAELTERLVEQIKPFRAHFHFGEMATGLTRLADGGFEVTAASGLVLRARIVVIAAGCGALRAKKPVPLNDWGLDRHEDLIAVDTAKFETSMPGVFAVGDAGWYAGKLALILSGFHEAALMAQQAFIYVKSGVKMPLQYTSSSSSLQRKLDAI
ncbi:MAG: FAD-dependent oxidoreductase [Proteobacteria bacterium]|nr:FAD-dependent oxidoreductase [Pseudomonadota bacterium]